MAQNSLKASSQTAGSLYGLSSISVLTNATKKHHVLPGGFIPGPNKPKNLDLFLFVAIHHLTALQNDGLIIWDASHDVTYKSDLYLLFPTADGLGLIYWDGMVGHSGKNGCRMYCGTLG